MLLARHPQSEAHLSEPSMRLRVGPLLLFHCDYIFPEVVADILLLCIVVPVHQNHDGTEATFLLEALGRIPLTAFPTF